MTKQELKKLNGDLWTAYTEISSIRRETHKALEDLETRIKQQMSIVSQAIVKLEKEDGDNGTFSGT